MAIIVLEGINGAGKSTLAKRLHNAVVERGGQCFSVDAAAYGRIGRALRQQIVRRDAQSTPDFDAMLFAALRMEGALRIQKIIREDPSITFILERWSIALGAYGAADGARSRLLTELRAVLDGALLVDATILLNLPGEIAYERIEGDLEKNRFELKGPAFLSKVADRYGKLARRTKGVKVVDALQDVEVVFRRVWATLLPTLQQ